MKIFVLGSFVQAYCWSMNSLPRVGESLAASEVAIEAGGKGLNVAIGCRRLNANVAICLGIGHDLPASQLLSLLEAEGMHQAHVHRLAAYSGHGAGLIAANGQNVIAVYLGPNLLLSKQHILDASQEISLSNLVYSQFETSTSATEQAFAVAKQYQVITVLNPSPWQPIAAEVLCNTDILVVNAVEVCDLLSIPPLSPSQSIHQFIESVAQALSKLWLVWQNPDQQYQWLVLTLEEHGSACFKRNQRPVYCESFAINAVDTTGAGDAFSSGLCVGLALKKPIPELLAYANACGAIVASKKGVLNALPNHKVVTQFIQNRRLT